MSLRTRTAAFVLVTGAGLLAGGLLAGPTGAAPADPPQSGDPRATAVAGNATTCAGAGLPGVKVTVGATVDATNTYLTITSVPAGVTLTGVVVKGGPAFNVYAGDQRTMLHAPLVPSGKPAQISHWFACGTDRTTTTSAPPTTTAPPTETSSPPSSSSAASSTAPASGSSTTQPAAGQAGLPPEGNLAATGTPVGPLLGLGGLLVLAGVGLLAAPALHRRFVQG
jgi:hypothetical protein